MQDPSGSQWCARHARSPALRRQRARPAPPRGVRPPVGPTSAFVPARGGGGRGDGGAPGIPLQALASHLRRGRGPGARAWGAFLTEHLPGCVWAGEKRLGPGPCPSLSSAALPSFEISGSCEPRPGPGQGTRGCGTLKSSASGSYYSAQVSTTGRDSPHQLACGARRGDRGPERDLNLLRLQRLETGQAGLSPLRLRRVLRPSPTQGPPAPTPSSSVLHRETEAQRRRGNPGALRAHFHFTGSTSGLPPAGQSELT